MVERLIGILLFQIAWFSAVIGGAHDLDFAASCPALALFSIHIFQNHHRWCQAAMSVAAIFVMGIVIELILLKSGVMTYHGLTASDSFPPLWILALWLAFAPLPDGALSWLQNRWALQVLFGAVGGPLSYLAGEKLGAATLHDNRLFAIAVLALAWSIATPLCFRFVARFSKRSCAIKAA